MLAPRRSDRSAATRPDCVAVAFPAIAVAIGLAGSNTVTMITAVTAAVTDAVTAGISVPAGGRCPTTAASAPTTTSTAATTTAASTMPECRSCGQRGQREREHEDTKSRHVAPPSYEGRMPRRRVSAN